MLKLDFFQTWINEVDQRSLYSNSDRDNPDCLIIDITVPVLNSLWSGIGMVVVLPVSTLCMIIWLPLRRTSVNP